MKSWFACLLVGLAMVAAIRSAALEKVLAADSKQELVEKQVSNASGEKAAADSPLGRQIDNFSLGDHRGTVHSLNDMKDRKLVVVAFLGAQCPVAKHYGVRLSELAKEYEGRGVGFVGINSNAQDSLSDLALYARDHKLTFPLLKDPANKVADRFSAQRTPEVFLLDAERKVRYFGRVDDQYGVGIQQSRATERELVDAIEELLAGKPVSLATKAATGCRIGRVPQVEPHGDVTYNNQIVRLLQKRCVQCHREGEVAPLALTDYQEVVGWAAMIREVVSENRMPPWNANPAHGSFKNDPRLTDEEKSQLKTWIENGCPEGKASDLPPPANFVTGWQIGQPDATFYMQDKPFVVPATGAVAYKYFMVDPGFTEDKWLQAVEIRPGNPAVVHHALILIQEPGQNAAAFRSGGALIGYSPGLPPTIMEPGTAIRVPAGSKFVFQMHYTPNGSEQQDRSYLGMVFADPKTVKHRLRGGAIMNHAIRIPAGESNYRLTGEQTVSHDVKLLSLTPHMHLRGKSFRFDAVFADGRRETLLDVPKYDFNWQLRYDLAEPKSLPRGTKVICTATYDNSANNPANPDPTKEVRWGDQTWEEMMAGFYGIIRDEE